MLKIASGVVAIFLLASAVAGADDGAVEDPRDESRAMDPIEVLYGHSEEHDEVLVQTVTAAETWEDEDLYELVLRIWVDGTGRSWDRRVVVTSNAFDDASRSSWRALVFDRGGRVRGHGNAWRIDDRSMRVEISRWLLGRRVDGYHWTATVVSACESDAEQGLCGGPQTDRVPDEGRIAHRL